jgi:hypothetical protein
MAKDLLVKYPYETNQTNETNEMKNVKLNFELGVVNNSIKTAIVDSFTIDGYLSPSLQNLIG